MEADVVRKPSGRIRYSQQPTRVNVPPVMAMLGLVYLAVPALALSLLAADEVRIGYLVGAVGLFSILLLLNIRDVMALKAGRWDRFRAPYTFTQMCLAVPSVTLLGLATGDRLGLVRPEIFLALLFSAIVFDGVALIATWGLCVAGVSVITWSYSESVADTAYLGAVYGITWGIGALIARLLRRLMLSGRDSAEGTADLANRLAVIESWSEVEGLLPLVMQAISGDRVAVGVAEVDPADGGPGERVGPFDLVVRPRGWIEPEAFAELAEPLPEAGTVAARGPMSVVRADGPAFTLVLVGPHPSSEFDIRISDSGAVTAANLLASACARLAMIDELQSLARTDALTGLGNRRHLFETLEAEFDRALRSGEPLTVALLDLDHFKHYNDDLGHPAGDRLLQSFARLLRTRVRAQDTIDRYGGEEFCLILPSTRADGASQLIDDIRAVGMPGEGPAPRAVTFSTGVAEWDRTEDADWLIKRADLALYRSKEAGRDRVTIAAPRLAAD